MERQTALATTEESKLSRLEGVIERNLEAFYEVGNALMQIREEKLYRNQYKTFEQYCREKWEMSKRHANRMIESAKVVSNLGPTGPIPTTESQIRPLAALPPDIQRQVWQEAVDTAPEGKVTAKRVEKVVQKRMKKTAKEKSQRGDRGIAPPYTPTHAMEFAGVAISQLEGIKKDDPKRSEALQKVTLWIDQKGNLPARPLTDTTPCVKDDDSISAASADVINQDNPPGTGSIPMPSDPLALVNAAIGFLERIPLDHPERDKAFGKLVILLRGWANLSGGENEDGLDFDRELANLIQLAENIFQRSTLRQMRRMAETLKQMGVSLSKAEETLRAKKAV